MGRLETKVGQLDSLHKRHLARPSFDDSGTEETEIKALTREISEVICFWRVVMVKGEDLQPRGRGFESWRRKQNDVELVH